MGDQVLGTHQPGAVDVDRGRVPELGSSWRFERRKCSLFERHRHGEWVALGRKGRVVSRFADWPDESTRVAPSHAAVKERFRLAQKGTLPRQGPEMQPSPATGDSPE